MNDDIVFTSEIKRMTVLELAKAAERQGFLMGLNWERSSRAVHHANIRLEAIYAEIEQRPTARREPTATSGAPDERSGKGEE